MKARVVPSLSLVTIALSLIRGTHASSNKEPRGVAPSSTYLFKLMELDSVATAVQRLLARRVRNGL